MEVNHHDLQIKWEFRYPPLIFGQISGLGLGKFLWWNSFPDFFPKRLPILTWFLACKSITMIYRSNLSFVKLHWFLAKLLAFDLVNFSDQTVFWTFFLNASRYWPDFWHVSQSPCFTDQVRVLLRSIDFWRNYWPWNLVNFSDQPIFRTFFLNACRYWPDFWHVSQSPCFTDRVWVSLCSIDFWRNNWPWNLVNFQQSNSFPDFLAHLSRECSVSYCNHFVSPSVHNLLVNTLASTNINQSSPNLVKMYVTTRARMSFIMELIGPELSEMSALEFENLPYLTMFIL